MPTRSNGAYEGPVGDAGVLGVIIWQQSAGYCVLGPVLWVCNSSLVRGVGEQRSDNLPIHWLYARSGLAILNILLFSTSGSESELLDSTSRLLDASESSKEDGSRCFMLLLGGAATGRCFSRLHAGTNGDSFNVMGLLDTMMGCLEGLSPSVRYSPRSVNVPSRLSLKHFPRCAL